ncbi:quinon protein alcohol dehydrogenase-like superfamily [Mycena vitilis]|nr:quinon protein alcohol dehydrogenase-like superfamily [Mycena vitilis]
MGSKLLAATKNNIGDILQMVDDQKRVTLPMKACKPGSISPNLILSIRVDDLDVAFVSARLANISPITNPNVHENFQQILRRLETLMRLTSAIAQLNPISTVVYSLAKGIAETIRERLAVNEKLAKMLHRMHRVLDFVELAEPFAKLQRCPDVVKETLTCITDCFLFIIARAESNPALLLLSGDGHRIEQLEQKLEDLHTRMRDSLTLCVAQSNTDVQDKIKLLVDTRYLRILSPLSMPVVAPHFRTTCFPGTRAKVISELTEWALLSSEKVLWMHAHAGSGKSTISTTMANVFESMGRLGSFVFFDRDVELRSEPSGMIRTIAYQLGCHRKDIAEGIHACVEAEGEAPIHDVTMEVQFRRLLVEPLAKTRDTERLVIIIDALDEGGNGPSQSAFLSLLSTGLPRLPAFVRVLITSRSYPWIQRTFTRMPDLRILDLNQDVDIDDDIRTFISAQMEAIRSQDSILSSDWPGIDVVDSLVKHAQGLFIWATVACSYIQAYDPDRRINKLLSSPSTLTAADESLNRLYGIAIEEAGPWLTDDFAVDMHNLLALVVISQNPQSLQGISDILGFNNGLTLNLISRLQSILRDETGPVHFIHPSVRDYLVDSHRCNGARWFVEEEEEHSTMTARCIDHLTRMFKSNVTSTLNLNADGQGRDAFVYSCVSWTYHAGRVRPTAEYAAKIRGFLTNHLLHWLEAISLLGLYRNAIAWMDQLQSWYLKFAESPEFDSLLSALLYDACRFLKAFAKTIERRPSAVYDTALQFCPKNSSISAIFNRDPKIILTSGCLREWSPCLMTLVTVGVMPVQTLMFSNFGETLAGCVDGATKIWKADAGTEIFSTPASRWVVSSLLRSDGKRLIEVTSKGGVCVWDVEAGAMVATFQILICDDDQRSKRRLACAALAADDHTFVCGFKDGMVQVWDTESQLEVTPLLDGHGCQVNGVAFSHNGQLVISGSDDHSIRIWSRTGVHQRTFLGHTNIVHRVAFSADDSKIASVSSDDTLRVWDVNTGSVLLNRPHSPDESIYVLAFSHPGDRLATGSARGIRIWDTETGQELMQPLAGHRGIVLALAFSPDDETLVSAAMDSQVRRWSVGKARPQQVSLEARHHTAVNCVALAHNRAHFASGSADNSLIVWNSDGTVSFFSRNGHSTAIVSVDFSADDAILASGSEDGTVLLWDAASGKMFDTVLKHSGELVALKFSNEGSNLATITGDSLRVWNIIDGTLCFDPISLPGCRYEAVTFSRDGMRVVAFYGYPRNESVPFNGHPFLLTEVPKPGLCILISDTRGNVLFDHKIDTVVEITEVHSVRMEYTCDDRCLVIWYGLSITAPDDMMVRAFDASTGEEIFPDPECPDFPEFQKPIGIKKEIRRSGKTIVEFPLDVDYMADVTCWDSTKDSTTDMIVVGSWSGDVYCITLNS